MKKLFLPKITVQTAHSLRFINIRRGTTDTQVKNPHLGQNGFSYKQLTYQVKLYGLPVPRGCEGRRALASSAKDLRP